MLTLKKLIIYVWGFILALTYRQTKIDKSVKLLGFDVFLQKKMASRIFFEKFQNYKYIHFVSVHKSLLIYT